MAWRETVDAMRAISKSKQTGQPVGNFFKNPNVITGNDTEVVNGKRKKKTNSILNLSSGVLGAGGGSINKKNAYGIGV